MKLLFIVVLSLLAVSYAWKKKAEPDPRTKNRPEDKTQTRKQETAAGSHTSKGVRRGKKLLSWRNF